MKRRSPPPPMTAEDWRVFHFMKWVWLAGAIVAALVCYFAR